ncbi:DNA helicase IV [Lentzea albidocapillata subsp. violacea]|uniref:DNA helicase IV n=1 Tax=Lentzea albidocapillata subsp. violacea TaxID=128104 RepID=A0A1G9U2S7_9PSEU|nr:RNA polymerase recycling motor ATPase HelR [Lentzea albidocapillata]SDM54218.1 DNA helicase IV [Lentzea albidocapillata subsp. violacea]
MGYEEELQSEREYVADLYARLDGERARVKAAYLSALGGTGETAMDRDNEVRARHREMKRLNVADYGLCFGRLDSVDGERSYIGRIGLFDEENEFEPALLDWRAPAARPFYTATGATPEGMRRRRQFLTRRRAVTGFTDEVFGKLGEEQGDVALLEALNAPRGEGMRDIVATIQSEQDAIIRLDHPGVLVIEGGPGTGKTVVALHRVAYLMYTQRERMERHGVLVVGPNPAFLNHIGRVLPSLGESDVVFSTAGSLLPGLVATAEDTPDVARIKGSRAMVDVLKAAVGARQRVPAEPIPIGMKDVVVQVGADVAEWARQEARDSGLPHNEARAVFREIVTYVLTERAIGRIGKGWMSRSDKQAWEDMRSGLVKDLADDESFVAALDFLWPIMTPFELLGELYSSAEALAAAGADPSLLRAEGEPWTISDVPLLDELHDLLGKDGTEQADDQAAAAERRAEARYAAEVLDSMVGRFDHMDDEDHLFASDMLFAEDLAERFEDHDQRTLAERALADRAWTYRHVVVDEAQELSEMDWRVLMRRCPGRSFTVVGDLAQRRAAAGATSWGQMLDPYVPGRWEYRSLTVNYRTPAEIMAVAAQVLAEFAPDVKAPDSVRANGVQPWARRVTEDELAGAIEEFTKQEAEFEGTSVVIGPPGVPGTVPAAETKGLEYDSVLVVAPERILAGGPRGAAELYVALTRATQRLGVLHHEALPAALSGLTETVRTTS